VFDGVVKMSTYRYRAVNGDIDIVAIGVTAQNANFISAVYGTLTGNIFIASTANITTSTLGTSTITTAYITTANLTNANVGILLAGSAIINTSLSAGTIVTSGSITSNGGITSNKSSSTKDYPVLAYQSALSPGQATSLLLGVSGTTNNSAEITFNYVADGSAGNSIGLGLFGNANKLTLTPSSIGTTLPITAPTVTFSPSAIPFAYSEGTWVPQFKYITSAGTANPLSTITYTKQFGYYVKTGRQVTVYFNIAFTSLGADLYVTSTTVSYTHLRAHET
jgi:hypothetical protein